MSNLNLNDLGFRAGTATAAAVSSFESRSWLSIQLCGLSVMRERVHCWLNLLGWLGRARGVRASRPALLPITPGLRVADVRAVRRAFLSVRTVLVQVRLGVCSVWLRVCESK